MAEQQTNPAQNHTVKQALEAKRRAAGQQSPVPETPRKTTPQRKLPVAAIVVAVLALVAALVAFKTAGAGTGAGDNPVVMTIDQYEITQEEYMTYVVPAQQVLRETYGEETLAQREDLHTLIRQTTEQNLFAQYTLLKWAEEYGITEDTISQEAFQLAKERRIAEYGGREPYLQALQAYGTTEAVQDRQLVQNLIIEELTQQDDPILSVSDEQLWEYYQEKELYTVKHVLLVADSFEAAEIKLASAQKVLEQALAGADFDQLVNLYSEDGEKGTHPDGYVCKPAEQEASFEKAALSIQPGEIYEEVVTTSYGYHILKRVQPDTAFLHKTLDDLILNSRIARKSQEIQEKMLVYYEPAYDTLPIAGTK